MATWVFQLNVLFCLPFESGDGGIRETVGKTLASASVWLGSPPTALASALFELHQVGQCSRRSRRQHGSTHEKLRKDTYYVLMAFNQFVGSRGSNRPGRTMLRAAPSSRTTTS